MPEIHKVKRAADDDTIISVSIDKKGRLAVLMRPAQTEDQANALVAGWIWLIETVARVIAMNAATCGHPGCARDALVAMLNDHPLPRCRENNHKLGHA